MMDDDYIDNIFGDANGDSIGSPVLLANYHSASVHSVPMASARTIVLKEENYLDYGGSGIHIEFLPGGHVKVYKLKDDSLKSCPFYPKSCTIPLQMSQRTIKNIADNTSIDSNHNLLAYDSSLDVVISFNIFDQRLEAYQYLSDLGKPRLIFKGAYSLKDSSDLSEIIEPFSCNNSRYFFTRTKKLINLMQLDSEEPKIRFQCLEEVPVTQFDQAESFKETAEFWWISQPQLLAYHIAVGLKHDQDETLLLDYDFDCKKESWRCALDPSDGEVISSKSVGLFWARNHPRLLFYCDSLKFGFFDTRMRDCDSFQCVMNRKKLVYVREWERFRGVHSLPLDTNQHILATDHKIILTDVRYPNKNLLQWNHMLSLDVPELSRNVLIKPIAMEYSNNPMNLIAVSNSKQICLMTTEKSSPKIIQPYSLHLPIHISQPIDCWVFSQATDIQLRNRLENAYLAGLAILNRSDGYSIMQLTLDGDIFAQDFFPREELNESQHWSWRSKGAPADAHLDSLSLETIHKTFDTWIEEYDGRVEEVDLCKEGVHINCSCEDEESPQSSDTEIIEDESDETLEFTGYNLDSILEGKLEGSQTFTRIMKKLYLNDSPNWDKYTNKILDGWESRIDDEGENLT